MNNRRCSNCRHVGSRVLMDGKRICFATLYRFHVTPDSVCPDYLPNYYVRPHIQVRFLLDFDYEC